MKIQKLRDVSRARDYVMGHIPFGFKVVARLTQNRSNFERGSFFVISPDTVDAESLANLGWSIPMVDRSVAIQLLGKVVKGFISNENNAVLLHDFASAVSDPGWDEYKYKDRATTYQGEICWVLKGPDTSDHEIEELISDWSSYFPVSGFFSAASAPERKKVLTDADLEELARNLIGVVVDIFDGDSFALWWREDLRPFPS
ncbi:MAG TPA: hypothetical protein VIX59_08295 [Candidatus Binataceae bacterium]